MKSSLLVCAAALVAVLAGCGSDSDAPAAPPPSEVGYACGLSEAGEIVCRGDDEYGQASPPGGVFVSVASGRFHGCAVRETGSVACWGDDTHGQASPPGGPFLSVTAGEFHTCGLRDERTLVCWGGNREVSPGPVEGTFIVVEAGAEYVCSAGEHDDVVCWTWVPKPCVWWDYVLEEELVVSDSTEVPEHLGVWPSDPHPLDWWCAYEQRSCTPDLFCGAMETCIGGILYPSTCGADNCDAPVGECPYWDEGPGMSG